MRLLDLGHFWILGSLAYSVQASRVVVQAGAIEYHGTQNSTARYST